MKPALIRALEGEMLDRIPFWYMRQAGRYLPEYNELRRGRTFIEVMESADLSVEISLQPYRRFKMDGVIMFSDILTPVRGAGIPLHFEEKKGPVLEKTVQSESDIDMFRAFQAEKACPYVKEILTRLRAHLASEEERPALLGFAGSPFTLASYLIEGGGTQKFEKTKECIFRRTELFNSLCDALTDLTIQYLRMQIDAGAEAVQIFDSWGGILSPAHYKEFSAPYTARIISALRADGKAPVILFVGNGSHLVPLMAEQKPDALSLDWRISADQVRREIPDSIAIQGNLDPLVLYGTAERTGNETRKVLAAFGNRKGYVFNLGHGIHPATPIENVQAMIESIRSFKRS